MKVFNFGKASTEEIETCHNDLQAILYLAITRTDIDFGISEGHRERERQYMLFLQGKSKIDGYKKEVKHNKKPSEAADIFIYHPDLSTRRKLAYNVPHLCYVAGIIKSCAIELYEAGEISHLIRWGGNWDKDNVLIIDQSFDDLPHFELYKP